MFSTELCIEGKKKRKLYYELSTQEYDPVNYGIIKIQSYPPPCGEGHISFFRKNKCKVLKA